MRKTHFAIDFGDSAADVHVDDCGLALGRLEAINDERNFSLCIYKRNHRTNGIQASKGSVMRFPKRIEEFYEGQLATRVHRHERLVSIEKGPRLHSEL